MSEPDASWWPRFDVSSAVFAELLTARFADRTGIVGSRKPTGELLDGVTRLYPANVELESPRRHLLAEVDTPPAFVGLPGELMNGLENDIYSGSNSPAPFGVTLQQSPLSSPEPGAITLMAALFALPTMLIVRKRLSTTRTAAAKRKL